MRTLRDLFFHIWVTARYNHQRLSCDGFDDPDERCPRHPSDCVCWKIRRVVEDRSLTEVSSNVR